MSDMKYLLLRRQTWYVQVRVPPSLYPILGKHKIIRSLKTQNLAEAKVRKHHAVGAIKIFLHEIANAGESNLQDRWASNWVAQMTPFDGAVSCHTKGGSTSISQALDDHLEELEKRGRRPSTINARRKKVEAFLEWLEGAGEKGQITKQRAGQYVSQALMKRSIALKTIKDTLCDLSAFFEWCSQRGQGGIKVNPFQGMVCP